MTCSDFGMKYLLYHYNELAADEAAEFKKHLDECDLCRERYREVVEALDAVGTLDEPMLPAEREAHLKERIKEALAGKPARTGIPYHRNSLATAIIAAGFLILIGLAAVLLSIPVSNIPVAPHNPVSMDDADTENETSPYLEAADYTAWLAKEAARGD